MEEIKLPDYNHSILNLITSILKYYKVETEHKSLNEIDNILAKNYKCSIYSVRWDGRTHIKQVISRRIF